MGWLRTLNHLFKLNYIRYEITFLNKLNTPNPTQPAPKPTHGHHPLPNPPIE